MKNLFLFLFLAITSMAYSQYIPDVNNKTDYQNQNLTSGFQYIKTGRQIQYFSTGLFVTGGIMIVDSRYSQNRITRNSGIALAAMGVGTWMVGESFKVEGYNRLHLGFFNLRIDIGEIKENQIPK